MSKSKPEAVQQTEATIPEEFKPFLFDEAQGFNRGGVLTEAERLFSSQGLAPQQEMGGILSGLMGGQQDRFAQQQAFIGQAQNQQQGLANLDLQNSAATQGIIDRSTGELQRQLDRGTIPTIGDAAINAGQFGSSRQGVAEGVATAEAQRGKGDVIAGILGQAQGQELQAQQFALQLAPMIQAMQGASLQEALGMGQLEQQFGDQAGRRDMENLIQYANLIQGFIPGGSGTTTSSGGGNSQFNDILGGLATAGSLAMMAGGSDKRLKKDLEFVTEKDGVKFWSWTWNKAGEALGYAGKAFGVIADELKEIYPELVHEKKGYLHVDYITLNRVVGAI